MADELAHWKSRAEMAESEERIKGNMLAWMKEELVRCESGQMAADERVKLTTWAHTVPVQAGQIRALKDELRAKEDEIAMLKRDKELLCHDLARAQREVKFWQEELYKLRGTIGERAAALTHRRSRDTRPHPMPDREGEQGSVHRVPR